MATKESNLSEDPPEDEYDPERYEVVYAEESEDDDDDSSVSFAIQPGYSLCIDGDGTIYSGMPDDPEPECDLTDLPIYKQHPNLDLYKRTPASCLQEQLDLRNLPKGTIRQYTCFICGGGQKHAYTA